MLIYENMGSRKRTESLRFCVTMFIYVEEEWCPGPESNQ